MNQYYRLTDQGEYQTDSRSTINVGYGEHFDWQFRKGQRIQNPPTIAISSTDAILEDMPWAGSGFVVSQRIREWFEANYPDAVQFIPTNWSAPHGRYPDYWLMNILYARNCIDWAHTNYASTRHPITGAPHRLIIAVTIDPELVGDLPIVLVQEYNVMTLIRSDLARTWQELGFTGCQFLPVAMTDTVTRRSHSSGGRPSGRTRI